MRLSLADVSDAQILSEITHQLTQLIIITSVLMSGC